MHEFALMESTLSIVIKEAKVNRLRRITRVGMDIGELSGAMPDALQFAFDVLRTQLDLFDEQSALEIRIIPAKARCTICNQEYQPDYGVALCPHCQLPSGALVSGEELQITYIDGEEWDQ